MAKAKAKRVGKDTSVASGSGGKGAPMGWVNAAAKSASKKVDKASAAGARGGAASGGGGGGG